MTQSRGRDLRRVLENLRRSERLLQAAIAEVEQMLTAEQAEKAEQSERGKGSPSLSPLPLRGLREDAAPYDAGVEEPDRPRGEFYGWELAPAVLELLRRANGATSNGALIASLESSGFEFKSKKHDVAVAQCLMRLIGLEKVARLSRGKWILVNRLAKAP